MPPDPHGPPADLDTIGKALYRKLRKFLQDQGTWADSDKHLLGQTCRYDQRRREAREALPRDEKGRVVMVSTGYKGQEVAHPLVKVMEAAEARFVDGLKELGLTPGARKRWEIEAGGRGAGKFGL